MAEMSGRATIIVTLITVLGGIVTLLITNNSNKKKEPGDSAHAVVQPTETYPKVNTKGIYISDMLAGSETEFFRFFSDGVVVNRARNLEEEDTDISTLITTADDWLNKSSPYTDVYNYTGDGHIKFSLNSAGVLYRYTGRIDEAGVIKVTSTGPAGPRLPENLSFTPFPE